jgi:hypothetical protein
MPDSQPQTLLQQFFYHLSMGTACQPKLVPMTPLHKATMQFEQAQMDLLEHAHLAEYHGGMVDMLNMRIPRLREDMRKFSARNEGEEQ